MKNKTRKLLAMVMALALCLTAIPIGMPMVAKAEAIEHDISAGPLTAVKGNDYIVVQSGDVEKANTITVANDYDGVIRLSGVNIQAIKPLSYGAGTLTANYVLELDGPNILNETSGVAALPVPKGVAVRIRALNSTEQDSLFVESTGGGNTAVIGSSAGNAAGTIIIDSGTITTKGGNNGSAIGTAVAYGGSANDFNSFTLIINGGKITANGSRIGIGGGRMVSIGTIVINGGDIVANGIGGLYENGADGRFDGGSIIINGGNITCNGRLGFSGGPAAGGQRATGSLVITGGNIRVTGGIGGGSAYNASGDYACYESVVILPEANISRTVALGVDPPESFAGMIDGTPQVGNAKNIFYMNEANLTNINGTTPTAFTIDTPHKNINVFADFSAYCAALDTLIKTANESKVLPISTSVFNMGFTEASCNLPLYYYNNMAAAPGTEIKFTASGCADKIMADATDITGGTVALTGSGTPETATPRPTPTPAPEASDISRLASLTYVTSFGATTAVSGFKPAHEGLDNEYNITLPGGKTAVYLEAKVAHSRAKVTVRPAEDADVPGTDQAAGKSIDVSSGTGSAIVTVTAQNGTKSEFKVNFKVGDVLDRTEDYVWFNDNRAGASSSGLGQWNVGLNAKMSEPNPAGSGNNVIEMTAAASTHSFLTKNFLELSGETIISTRVYIPSASKPNTDINLNGNLMSFKDDGTYTFGTHSDTYDFDTWMKLDFHIMPGSDSNLVTKWANTEIRAYINGEFVAEKLHPLTYSTMTVGPGGMPYSGWGQQTPQLQLYQTKYLATAYIDGVSIVEPHDFIITETEVERYNDLANNMKLDGDVIINVNHDIDMTTFAGKVKVYEDGAEITPTSIAVTPSFENKIVVSFANDNMQPYTYYEFVLDGELKDITGRKISPEAASVGITTGGEQGQMPPAITPLVLEEGQEFIMPDEFNTGYYSVDDYNDFPNMLNKYPDLGLTGKQVRITQSSIDTMIAKGTAEYDDEGRVVFKGFKIIDGSLNVEASNVLVEDFYINSFEQSTNYSVGGGAKNVVAQDGELFGSSGTSVGGENVKLLRMHIHSGNADGLKPSSGWWVESCYLHDFGHGYLAHADGAQISGDRYGLTNDIRMYGNRIDMPPMQFFNMANATIFFSLDFGPIINVDIQYNWFNGAGNCVVIGAQEKLCKNVTYKNNYMGCGRVWSALNHKDIRPEDIGSHDVQWATEFDDVNVDIPSAGSVVYKNENGERIYDLIDAGGKVTIMTNFANFTTREQKIKVVAELYNSEDELLDTASPALEPLPRYTPVSEYYSRPVREFQDLMAAYMGVTLQTGGSGEAQNNAATLNSFYAVPGFAEWVENELNQRSDLNIRADWWLYEHAKTDADRSWFFGMKEAQELPISVQRAFDFNVTPAAGDYIKVSVYKDWNGAKADQLLRPADIIECSGEPAELPILTVSDIAIESGQITANVRNAYNTTKTVDFIVARYNGDMLVNVALLPKEIAADHDGPFSFTLEPAPAGSKKVDKIKVMAWKSGTQEPLCAAYEEELVSAF